ncbi:MAG TPA: glycosyl hydrolase [Streptosporangiaceae bacterium]|nr:glycosyl hydrolase [Streptosporangiaceae bacterium]
MTARARPLALAAVTLTVVLAGCGALSAPSNSAGTSGQRDSSSPQPTAPAPGSVPFNVSGLLDPAQGKFLGIEAVGAPDSMAPVNAFAMNTGRKPNLVGQYVSWGEPFDVRAAENAWSYGALYYMAWEPFGTSVQAIADGQSNGYVTRFAKAIRALNVPVALSFGHEMNGNWYPWGTTQTTAAEFVAAWRHIHRLFARAGASNVIWVWNPNIINPVPQVALEPYWPGDAYVDWVGITGYYATTGADTYASLFRPTIAEIRKFTAKPVIIAETAIETGPDEVQDAASLVDTVTSHPTVLGFIYFDYNKGGVDWQVESRPEVRAAIAGDIAGLPLVNPRK